SSQATVTLAEIPFVRLRHGLPEALLEGRAGFLEVVRTAQQLLGPPELKIDLRGRYIVAGGHKVSLPPAELAFLSWFARRKLRGQPGLSCPTEGHADPAYARDFLAEYHRAFDRLGPSDRCARALRNGMDKNYFLQRRSKLHKLLRRWLGPRAGDYMIQAVGRRPETRYELKLEAAQIHYLAGHEEAER
ncbi:MAG: hypothetical protein RMI94_07285, partial [Bryobacterales bacterium]|nr:hypothetical protein [Bryobacteraceae bacterium]MDW8130336.1 hypothetical protein [Bryobacterales bacterium]